MNGLGKVTIFDDGLEELIVPGLSRDVTESKRAEGKMRKLYQQPEPRIVERTDELRKNQKLFQTLARVSPVGIFRTDPEGHCTFVSQGWCEMAGLTPEEAQGEAWARALHPEDRKRVFEEWYKGTRENGDSLYRTEARFQRPDGVVT